MVVVPRHCVERTRFSLDLHVLSADKVFLDAFHHFVDGSTRRCNLLGRVEVLVVSCEQVNVLSSSDLLEFFERLEIVGLDRVVEGVHLAGTAELVEVESRQIFIENPLLGNVFGLADVVDVLVVLQHSGLLVRVQPFYFVEERVVGQHLPFVTSTHSIVD